MQESRPKIVIDFRAEMNIFNDSFDHKLMPTDSRLFSKKAVDVLGPRKDVITCEICHMACNFSHNVWQVSSI